MLLAVVKLYVFGQNGKWSRIIHLLNLIKASGLFVVVVVAAVFFFFIFCSGCTSFAISFLSCRLLLFRLFFLFFYSSCFFAFIVMNDIP